jgi:Glycosyltransferase
LAAVQAFQKVFSPFDSDVLLVIKFSNAHHYPVYREQLLHLVQDWSCIHLIEGHLPKEKIHALLYNCDCYVSLHRAEGFGLGMAEAMFYGKPVIATAYSSNMDFMNVGNSFLVQYDLVTTTEDYGPYPKGSIWAEADIDHAASVMQYVYDNYTEAQKLGAIAAADLSSLLSPEAVGIKIKSRLQYITRKMKNLKSLSSCTRITKMENLLAEKDWWASQVKLWRETAKQTQIEFQRCNL